LREVTEEKEDSIGKGGKERGEEEKEGIEKSKKCKNEEGYRGNTEREKRRKGTFWRRVEADGLHGSVFAVDRLLEKSVSGDL
jgi:hypothetical protein